MDQSRIIVKNEKDEDVVCNVILTYHSDQYSKDYIVYENASNREIYASIYVVNEGNYQLIPIESMEEYNMLEEILSKMKENID